MIAPLMLFKSTSQKIFQKKALDETIFQTNASVDILANLFSNLPNFIEEENVDDDNDDDFREEEVNVDDVDEDDFPVHHYNPPALFNEDYEVEQNLQVRIAVRLNRLVEERNRLEEEREERHLRFLNQCLQLETLIADQRCRNINE
ncbi:hypothetical protein AKO1_005105 [Acrasis kona]|uniref:Uncharacterized protein n=1 Tax=Acrasis kona TaxID=1008807 RepID=A0AAW2Z426_9EUKA